MGLVHNGPCTQWALYTTGLVHDGPCTQRDWYTMGNRSRVQRTQILNTHLFRTQSSKLLLLKAGAGPHIAMHSTPTATDFFLANF